jgi:hypothetical protein
MSKKDLERGNINFNKNVPKLRNNNVGRSRNFKVSDFEINVLLKDDQFQAINVINFTHP